MAKQKTAQPTSTCGLTEADRDALNECLAGLEPIRTHESLYGGNEVAKARELERRLKNRLAPEAPQQIVAEATAFIAQFAPFVENNRTQEREAEQAAATAEYQRVRKAHAAKQAAIVEKERQRKIPMIEARDGLAKEAVAEVIG